MIYSSHFTKQCKQVQLLVQLAFSMGEWVDECAQLNGWLNAWLNGRRFRVSLKTLGEGALLLTKHQLTP